MTNDLSAELGWDLMRLSFGRRCKVLAAFAAAMALLIAMGYYVLRDQAEYLTILWPASGLLFFMLWTTPHRNWIWFLGIQFVVQMGIYLITADAVNWRWGPWFALADSLDAVVGAMLAKRLMTTHWRPEVWQVVLLFGSMAAGSGAGAVMGALTSIQTAPGTGFLRQWQLWWAGSWLGSLLVAPLVLAWWVRFAAPQKTDPAAPHLDMLLTGASLLGFTAWTFASRPASMSTILQSPVLVLGLSMVAAFRMAPRWNTTFCTVAAVIAAYFSSLHLGPFALEAAPFSRIANVQLNLVAFITINFILVVALFENRNTVRQLSLSDKRYRLFVERTSEAIWQIELSVPMPLGLERTPQIEWLRQHAYVAECNLAYRQLNVKAVASAVDSHAWSETAPWTAVYLDNLERAASQGYSIDGLQFSVTASGRRSTYLATFSGVVEANRLVRLWGVARDITDLVDLNERLRQKQERVQMYARQLVGAEERARRATAVDLHDGIGQQLAGLALTFDAAAARSPPEVRLLLSEATHTLREIHGITRRMIADLSPPGLYELGLTPALQWLCVYMRGQDNLQVELEADVDETAFDLELRILAFKLIRELLRNVVKHAGVETAKVTVKVSNRQLRINVLDHGVGFEWQYSLFETRSDGFGLWSVAERVREAGGELTVDTAPGKGCSVSVMLPLRRSDAGQAGEPRKRNAAA